jgi:hypothetical protein
MIHTPTQTRKIKAIIRTHLVTGADKCAAELNYGGFPAPGSTKDKKIRWKPEQISPYLNNKPVPVKKRKKVYRKMFAAMVTIKMHREVSKQENISAFIREAISEKIARME